MKYNDQHRELIEQCRRGDRKAFREVYHLYSRSMYNVALRMTGLTHIAEDILQEAFTDAFTTLDKFRNDSTFGAWLKRIIVFKCYDYLNSKSSRLEFLEDLESFDLNDPETTFNEEDLTREIQRIKEAILLLPAGSRTVLNLYLFEGYDHEEIGQIMNISESTSKTQYMRAKLKLRNLLTQSNINER